jgi:ABC-type Zn uptake system ZnuABC Zn-binding protein ZnuA
LTKNIVGDAEGVQLDILLPPDASPHGYSLRPEDKKKIADADVVVLNGYDTEFELTIEEAIRDENPDVRTIEASAGVEPLRFGNGASSGGAHSHSPGQEGTHGHDRDEATRDPHTWVSPRQALILVGNIRDGLAELDPARAEWYRSHADSFLEALSELADEYEAASRDFRKREIVTGHHAFGYLARDLDLEIVAVIEEIPQQEPSAAGLQEIIDRIRASGAAAVFAEPQVRSDVARTIAEETGLPVRTLDPLGTGRMDPGEYIRVMRKNLDELKRALM